ncbi:hypothetical protein L596_021234 [Steinernema carpocapsae]|uniref:FLYWCH-type domain-containing protein n=1 Tax=Steinernema carpocapsae TaxID=34508 RepID=A0A4U5MW77_STECR|nr:hypothetical protein L596_021229 [Steinernema carpocapsae]TKR73999.1 hypothetical protein L596_021234 [Steinernema carpocapsae]
MKETHQLFIPVFIFDIPRISDLQDGMKCTKSDLAKDLTFPVMEVYIPCRYGYAVVGDISPIFSNHGFSSDSESISDKDDIHPGPRATSETAEQVFLQTARGNPLVAVSGFQFVQHGKPRKDGSQLWRYVKEKEERCKARAVSKPGSSILRFKPRSGKSCSGNVQPLRKVLFRKCPTAPESPVPEMSRSGNARVPEKSRSDIARSEKVIQPFTFLPVGDLP